MGRFKFIKNYWVNEGPKAVFVFLYMCANVAVFVQGFLKYKNSEYFAVLSYGICIAKGSAATIKLNSACILIPVLRNFLSWVRGTWVNTYIPIDKNIVFHKCVGWLIALGSASHSVAHFWNFNRLAHSSPEALASIGFKSPLTMNYLSYQTLPGVTGYLLIGVMVFMFTTAIGSVRRPNFEVFWFTHHLFVLFFALGSVHGAMAYFGKPSFWYWVIGPLFLYIVERTLRFLRGRQPTMLIMAQQHPSRVIELRMKKMTFVYKPGQYLYLNCPYIARNEWHPFTITSSPDEEFVSVHICVVGNWTGKLAALLNPKKQLGVVQQNLLEAPDGSKILTIDGPYGAASEHVFNYKTVVLVGAGIGVTPFGSILKHIAHEIKMHKDKPPIDKVYFYWICRDKNSFEWFSSLLRTLEEENVNNFLEIRVHLTGALSVDEVYNVMYEEGDKPAGGDKAVVGVDKAVGVSSFDPEASVDSITGLTTPTFFGRPKWRDAFADIAKKHPNSRVGVFYCGPPVLSKQLYNTCRTFTSTDVQFHYHKENF